MKTRHILATATALAALAPAGAVATNGHQSRTYEFQGPVTAVDLPTGKVTVDIKGGDRDGLKAIIGQASTQTFATGPATKYVTWNAGVPANGALASIAVGQTIRVHVRQVKRAPLSTIVATPASRVGVVVQPLNVKGPRWRFVGACKSVNGNQVTFDVTGGNWLALYKMLGQPVTQTVTIDPARTVLVNWNAGAVSSLSPAQLPQYCADTTRQMRIVLVGPREATLAQALAGPALRIAFAPAPISPYQA